MTAVHALSLHAPHADLFVAIDHSEHRVVVGPGPIEIWIENERAYRG